MVKRVLILGGYGNFGSYIARSLAPQPDIKLLVAGRSQDRAAVFAKSLAAANSADACALDVRRPLDEPLRALSPDMVIHTVGPFQGQNYAVAKACVRQRCHYVDLADGRAFVAGIGALNERAKTNDVLVVAGASSVPCLTAAIIDEALPRFSRLKSIDYGISAAQQTNRGLATASSVLSYIGRPFTSFRHGAWQTVFGWQDLHVERYPELGLRLFGNCDVPDLELFPSRYEDLRSIRFCAGHEIKLLHIAMWLLSWGVRTGLLPSLGRYSDRLLRLSSLFDALGSSKSGLHMYLHGLDEGGRQKVERLFMIARSGEGPFIPCIPAILLAKRLARGDLIERGARPCLDLIEFGDYLRALKDLDIQVIRAPNEWRPDTDLPSRSGDRGVPHPRAASLRVGL